MPTAVRLDFFIVLYILTLQTQFLSTVRAYTRYEGGYGVTTKFSGNRARAGSHIHSIYPDFRKDVYLVVDSTNSTILKLTLPLSEKSRLEVIAGSGVPGHKDGAAEFAQFKHPKNAVVDDEGTIYVADSGNAAIRKISGGRVTTLAGGSFGFTDGSAEDARFSADIELYLDRTICALIVADRGNNAIRRILLDLKCCKSPWDGFYKDPSAGLLTDRKFLYGLAGGAVAMFAVLVLFVYRMLLQEWFMKAWRAIWGGLNEVLLAIGSVCHILLDSFRRDSAPEQAALLSKEPGTEEAGLLPPLIDFSDHAAKTKNGAKEYRLPKEESAERGRSRDSEDSGWDSSPGLSFRQKALTLPGVITPDFIPAVRSDVDLIDDPTAAVSLTVIPTSDDSGGQVPRAEECPDCSGSHAFPNIKKSEEKAPRLLCEMTPDFVPAVRPDFDLVEDPTAPVSLTLRPGTGQD